MVTNGDNDDPSETMMVQGSYNGISGDNNDNGNYGTNGTIEWRCAG